MYNEPVKLAGVRGERLASRKVTSRTLEPDTLTRWDASAYPVREMRTV
jgi:hypothetical protein